MQLNSFEPITISAKEAAIIINRCEETARRRLREIREKLGKTPEQVITLEEFCEYVGLDVEKVRAWYNRG